MGIGVGSGVGVAVGGGVGVTVAFGVGSDVGSGVGVGVGVAFGSGVALHVAGLVEVDILGSMVGLALAVPVVGESCVSGTGVTCLALDDTVGAFVCPLAAEGAVSGLSIPSCKGVIKVHPARAMLVKDPKVRAFMVISLAWKRTKRESHCQRSALFEVHFYAIVIRYEEDAKNKKISAAIVIPASILVIPLP